MRSEGSGDPEPLRPLQGPLSFILRDARISSWVLNKRVTDRFRLKFCKTTLTAVRKMDCRGGKAV